MLSEHQFQTLGSSLDRVTLAVEFSLQWRRRRADEAQAWADARLVLVRGTGEHPLGRDEHGFQFELRIYFTNHSAKPILDVHVEAWPAGADRGQPASWAVHAEIVRPGDPAEPREFFAIHVTSTEPYIALEAWRVRWTDTTGRQWCGDQIRQYQPLPFSGQPPRVYTGQPDRMAHMPTRNGWFSAFRKK